MTGVREADLYPLVIEFFSKMGYLVFTEHYINYRRADILSIRLDNNETKWRIKNGVPRIPMRTFLRVMKILENNSSNIKDIAESLGLSPNYVRKLIKDLDSLYFKIEHGTVMKMREYSPFTNEVIAIEVKVRDWKEGLIQAYEYLIAVHRSYLALYGKYYKKIPDKVLKWIKDKGIGVLVIEDGMVYEKIPAKIAGPKSQIAYYKLAESLWDKVVRILNHRLI